MIQTSLRDETIDEEDMVLRFLAPAGSQWRSDNSDEGGGARPAKGPVGNESGHWSSILLSICCSATTTTDCEVLVSRRGVITVVIY